MRVRLLQDWSDRSRLHHAGAEIEVEVAKARALVAVDLAEALEPWPPDPAPIEP